MERLSVGRVRLRGGGKKLGEADVAEERFRGELK